MKIYRIIKKDPITDIIKSSLINLPTPSRISFIWNIGFLLGVTLLLQIITGVFLSINYISHTETAFESVVHIIRDIKRGFYVRYTHINGASLFFILIYAHIRRGIYFNSPFKIPIVWLSGVLILLTTIGAAFMGYVLPWGQISFWGATVITRILSAVPYLGEKITLWLWGNFSVSQPTLTRFFSIHYLLPILVIVIVIIHLIFLHEKGSSNPLGLDPNLEKVKFFPNFAVKDIIPIVILRFIIISLISNYPDLLGDVENFNPASISTTPPHIQPEWYFLFAYAILRSIPSKLGGVTAILASIIVLLILPIKNKIINNKFNPYKKITFWFFVCIVILLSWVGANAVEQPFTIMGKILTSLYFLIFIII